MNAQKMAQENLAKLRKEIAYRSLLMAIAAELAEELSLTGGSTDLDRARAWFDEGVDVRDIVHIGRKVLPAQDRMELLKLVDDKVFEHVFKEALKQDIRLVLHTAVAERAKKAASQKQSAAAKKRQKAAEKASGEKPRTDIGAIVKGFYSPDEVSEITKKPYSYSEPGDDGEARYFVAATNGTVLLRIETSAEEADRFERVTHGHPIVRAMASYLDRRGEPVPLPLESARAVLKEVATQVWLRKAADEAIPTLPIPDTKLVLREGRSPVLGLRPGERIIKEGRDGDFLQTFALDLTTQILKLPWDEGVSIAYEPSEGVFQYIGSLEGRPALVVQMPLKIHAKDAVDGPAGSIVGRTSQQVASLLQPAGLLPSMAEAEDIAASYYWRGLRSNTFRLRNLEMFGGGRDITRQPFVHGNDGGRPATFRLFYPEDGDIVAATSPDEPQGSFSVEEFAARAADEIETYEKETRARSGYPGYEDPRKTFANLLKRAGKVVAMMGEKRALGEIVLSIEKAREIVARTLMIRSRGKVKVEPCKGLFAWQAYALTTLMMALLLPWDEGSPVSIFAIEDIDAGLFVMSAEDKQALGRYLIIEGRIDGRRAGFVHSPESNANDAFVDIEKALGFSRMSDAGYVEALDAFAPVLPTKKAKKNALYEEILTFCLQEDDRLQLYLPDQTTLVLEEKPVTTATDGHRH